jgi:hypothetical protein
MALGRPMLMLVFHKEEVRRPQAFASSCLLPHAIMQRDRIVLACGAAKQILVHYRVTGSRFTLSVNVLCFDGRMRLNIRRFHAWKLYE